MTEAQVHKVRFEPVGVEMEVEEGETVLDAAFRQGISLMHGCKEGQCGSCKSKLIEGDIELLKYSTFALPDYESETSHVLLCRTHAYSDVSFELLNYDEDLLSRSIAVKAFSGRVAKISALTSDIRLLEIEIETPLKFWAGQYVDLTLRDGDITRAFSMANPPSDGTNLRFIIKKYPNGAFSSQLDGKLSVRCRYRQGAVWDLLPSGSETRPDVVDRRRLRDVAAVVDPGRSHRKRRAKTCPVLLRGPDARRPLLP